MPKAVLVTTESRGVFFGFIADSTPDFAEHIVLTGARNAIYWPSIQGGVFGLASHGPADGARIGETVERICLRRITAVADCTPAAAEKWASWPVHRGQS